MFVKTKNKHQEEGPSLRGLWLVKAVEHTIPILKNSDTVKKAAGREEENVL